MEVERAAHVAGSNVILSNWRLGATGQRTAGLASPSHSWLGQLDWNQTTVVFSGDLGRYDDVTTVDPVSDPCADYLVIESTTATVAK